MDLSRAINRVLRDFILKIAIIIMIGERAHVETLPDAGINPRDVQIRDRAAKIIDIIYVYPCCVQKKYLTLRKLNGTKKIALLHQVSGTR